MPRPTPRSRLRRPPRGRGGRRVAVPLCGGLECGAVQRATNGAAPAQAHAACAAREIREPVRAMTRTSLAAIAAVLAFATPSVARSAPPADDARARAAESFREAQAAFARRDFAAAAAAFEAAADFAPHPAALLSASEAWERAGEPARAADDCDRARSLPVAAERSEER